MYGKSPLDVEKMYEELKKPKYKDIFDRVYRPTAPQIPEHAYEYDNPYTRQEFEIIEFPPDQLDAHPVSNTKEEQAIVCLLRQDNSDELVPLPRI